MTNANKITRVCEIDFLWQGIAEIEDFVKKLADMIYIEKKFSHKVNGIDFYIDSNFTEQIKNTNLILTKWGYDIETSFHCVTGYALYDLIPWWKKMQSYFENQLDLIPWLPYPCLLISHSSLRRHSDKGRPTAFNYPIFGNESITNYIWESMDEPDNQYVESYKYQTAKTILLDTTSYHGGLLNSGFPSTSLRAICNMGFKNDFTECYTKIKAAEVSGQLNVLGIK
jgi:hypothetical protein